MRCQTPGYFEQLHWMSRDSLFTPPQLVRRGLDSFRMSFYADTVDATPVTLVTRNPSDDCARERTGNHMQFEGKMVIVTGGAAGIGRGCCEVFHAAGGFVTILDRDLPAAQSVAEKLNAERAQSAFAIGCDVADFPALEAALQQAIEHFGRIDCLINNAGVHPPATPIEEFSIAQMEELMRVNFLSTYAASRFVLPALRKTRGTIVNMSSMTAVLGQHLSSAYAATKGAQVSFTKALALEAGKAGVRVNAVLPSNVDPPLMRAWAETLDDPASALERVAGLQVFGRMADPQEIGRVCLFLASEDSSFLTGQAIEADGGAALDY